MARKVAKLSQVVHTSLNCPKSRWDKMVELLVQFGSPIVSAQCCDGMPGSCDGMPEKAALTHPDPIVITPKRR